MNHKSIYNLFILVTFGLLLFLSSCKKDDNCVPGTTANAGEDQIVMGNSTTLAANTPTSGAGVWTIVSGSAGDFADPLNPKSTFTGSGVNNTYVLRWTISGCPISEDEVQIEFKVCVPASTSNAGQDQLVYSTSTTLAGNTPASGTGSWSIISGDGGNIAATSNPTSAFSGVTGNSYVLRWTITGCPASEDDVQIDFTNDPILLTIDKTSVMNGEIITVTGLNFSANYNGGSQIKTLKMADPYTGAEVFLPILSRTETEIKAVVVGSNGGAIGTYDLSYSKKPGAEAATYFSSDLSFDIVAATGFFTSSTFTATNLNPGDEVSFGVKNGSTVSTDYTVKLVNYNYTSGVMTEYDVTPTLTANGYDTMDKISFNLPVDLPAEEYHVKVTYGDKTLIGGWGSSLNVF